MSSTLNWQFSGIGSKSGITIGAMFTDMLAMFNAKATDPAFSWQVASSNVASTPYQITLKRKDGSVGRILLVAWSTSPAGSNAAILDGTPLTSSLFGAYFPSGNVDTPSNLTAGSGTILGDDTGCVKVWSGMSVSTIYTTNYSPFYFDTPEAIYLGFGVSTAVYFAGAGKILVDAADNAYDGVISTGTATSSSAFGSGTGLLPWSATKPAASSNTPCIRTNYGSTDRAYFFAWSPSGPWAATAKGSGDILSDTAQSKAWFFPVMLIGQTKGEGMVLKLRQIAYGPASEGQFQPYYTTGPVLQARHMCASTSGGNGHPWLTNFKL